MQPYSLQALGEKLKAQGLPMLEDGAEKAYAAMKEWLQESSAATSSPVDDMVVSLLPALDKVVVPALEKIDGQ
jgi:hypothetical protein